MMKVAEKKQVMAKPKKLSKAGEWLMANQGKNLGRIVDWRAVMK